jgi:ubiquinone/menaquinone biosynthesis C-methylase UbiE
MSHVCPWWGGYLIDNPLRRLIHNAERILGPYVTTGMAAMDVGCGMGLFSIAMAKLVGDSGRVIAVDLQEKMLDAVRRRARQAGVDERIRLHRCERDRLGVDEPVDFVLTFAMVHEVHDQERLLREIYGCLKPGGKWLIAEPRLHVSGKAFAKTVATAEAVGLRAVEEPRVRWCRAVVFDRA